mmetsp:Transcript_63343/g.151123  ORF Transcript_63343/g.151123 Transcript_63343/m.151123 type:complete len:949 (-) Transcript_63343:247-3093(-)
MKWFSPSPASARESQHEALIPSTGQCPGAGDTSSSSAPYEALPDGDELASPREDRDGPSCAPASIQALKSLRLLVVMHIALAMSLGHRLPVDLPLVSWPPSWGLFIRAGHCSYSMLVFLTGFLLTCEYGHNDGQSPHHIGHRSIFLRHAVRLYPPYLLSIVIFMWLRLTASDAEVKPAEVAEKVLWKVLCLDTWEAEKATQIHHHEEAHRFVGGMLLLHAIFQPAFKLMQGALVTRRSRMQVLISLWLVGSTLQAASNVGVRVSPLPLLFMAFRIHACEFIAGMVLGLMWLDGQLFKREIQPFMRYLPSMSVAALMVAYSTVDICRFGVTQNGLLLPVQGLLAASIISCRDLLSKTLMSEVAVAFGALALPALASMDITLTVVDRLPAAPMLEGLSWLRTVPQCLALLGTLLMIATVMNITVVRVAGSFVARHRRQTLPLEGLDDSRSSDEYKPPEGSYCRTIQKNVVFYGIFLAFNVSYFSLIFYWLVHRPMLKGGPVADLLGEHPVMAHLVGFFKWAIAAPATFLSILGQVVWNPMVKEAEPSVEKLLANDAFSGCKMRFRYVTRGMNVSLIRANVEEALRVLRSVPGLPESAWEVEVVTDRFIGINGPEEKLAKEIVVPMEYAVYDEYGSETKYKARALNYAIEHGGAEDGDWIIHLDEETRFDPNAVVMILQHCVAERQRVTAQGGAAVPAVGQGVILYGTGRCGPVVNWVTTLADSIRVADDFGKFRLQFQAFERPFIGMHGSYVVTNHAVEKAVGFRYGMPGSITEDAHWSLMAAAHHDVRFKWIDAYMYEQSPFDLEDFMKQRRRWFAGIWLVCKDVRIPLRWRVLITFMNFWWLLSLPLGAFGTLAAFSPADMTTSYMVAVAMAGTFSTWNYVIGFIMTYRPSEGLSRYVVLFCLQLLLQPFFMFLEYSGVVLALVKPAFGEFHIVQKEVSATRAFKTTP